MMICTAASEVRDRFMRLPQGKAIQVEYIWTGGKGASDLRSKTRTLPGPVTNLKDIPLWNYDGSSTDQAEGKTSEVTLRPVKFVPDPFRLGNNILVLCDGETMNGEPAAGNTRSMAKVIFDEFLDEEPWFGIEQEYTMLQVDGRTPLGWPTNGFPAPQGPYYCGVGAENAFGRHIVEAHYRACLYAGINISGINAEVMAGQWEFQIGPCTGIDSGDQLILSRYLMLRVAEEFGVRVSFDPKPVAGDWNGAGCHTNFSTKAMRVKGGYDVILKAMGPLKAKHQEHIQVYGSGNDRRLTGRHETANIDDFSYGVADRGASVRIPSVAYLEQRGYLEDRRPAANMDPYAVTSKITDTICSSRRQETKE